MGTVPSWRSRGSRRSSTRRRRTLRRRRPTGSADHRLAALGASGDDGEFATLQPPDGDSTAQGPGGGVPVGRTACTSTCIPTTSTAWSTTPPASVPRCAMTELGYAVGRSPGGLVFCLVPAHRSTKRPGPVSWPGGASLVDQVCLDIPAASFDSEAQFWSMLTGWPHVEGGSPKFDRILPPPGQPLQMLLQRVDEQDGSGAGCTSTSPVRTGRPRWPGTSRWAGGWSGPRPELDHAARPERTRLLHHRAEPHEWPPALNPTGAVTPAGPRPRRSPCRGCAPRRRR